MNDGFARASGVPGATSARITTEAKFPPGSVPARSASRRLRPSQQPTGVPIQAAVIPSGGMRPSQIAVVRSGVLAAIPPISSAAGGPSAGLRPSQVGLLREGDGAAKLRIQRCGIGSSCDCPPRDKLAGTEHDLHRATAAGGTPLPATSRERMESAFSSDFAAVRVHTGAAAHDAASALGARALTAGTDILFRAGEYQPGAPGGDRLLAHELAHVVQQAHDLPQGILDTGATDHLEKSAGLAADHASPAAEREAHGAAMIAAMGEPVPTLSRQPPAIARQDDPDDLGTQPDVSTSDSQASLPPAPAAPVASAEATPSAGGRTVDTSSDAYLSGYNDGRAGNPAAPGPLSPDALDDYTEGYQNGAAEAENAQASLPPVPAAPDYTAAPSPAPTPVPPPSTMRDCDVHLCFVPLEALTARGLPAKDAYAIAVHAFIEWNGKSAGFTRLAGDQIADAQVYSPEPRADESDKVCVKATPTSGFMRWIEANCPTDCNSVYAKIDSLTTPGLMKGSTACSATTARPSREIRWTPLA